MHPATRQKLEAFARSVNWTMPHPLHRRKFQKFVIEAFERGDTRLTLADLAKVIRACCDAPPRYLDEWIREYERGIELLQVNRTR